MTNRNTVLSLLLVLIIFSTSACKIQETSRQSNKTSNAKRLENAEAQCLKGMEIIRPVYAETLQSDRKNRPMNRQIAYRMSEALKKLDTPVLAEQFNVNMSHYEKMESFIQQMEKGEKAEMGLYQLHTDGGLGWKKFLFDGEQIYVIYANASWNENAHPVLGESGKTQVKSWEYTEKGWFCYEYRVPEPPEVTELLDGNVMFRVKPLPEEQRRIAEKYVKPVAYKGNNLLLSSWDSGHMEGIDYNGLFEALYFIAFRERFQPERFPEGIPAEEFENLMTKYLPVSAEQIREYAVFDEEKQTYDWKGLGCGNYTLTRFGTSVPEITDIQEVGDGTLILSVDAVCEMGKTDVALSHILTIKQEENGDVRYISNEISEKEQKKLPIYKYRTQQ